MAESQGAKMDVKEMMEIYEKLAIPGDPHKLLAALEGSWTTKTVFWMEPGKPPMEATGTCEQKMIMDGLFLEQVYGGDMMGKKFTGINIIGYNNYTGRYGSVWIDNMGSGIYCFEGSEGPDGKSIIQESRYDDPVQGATRWRSIMRIRDDRTVLYEASITGKSGKEEKMMEMTLTRKA
ncbi:MAG TPA: DUF1579 domain-containing protein [Syntrophorhabdaceae bacterium]|jgi:hypothetical protein